MFAKCIEVPGRKALGEELQGSDKSSATDRGSYSSMIWRNELATCSDMGSTQKSRNHRSQSMPRGDAGIGEKTGKH